MIYFILNLSNILTAYGINVHIASRHSIAGASIPFCVTSEIKIHDLGGDELPKSFLQKCRLNIKLLQNFCKLIKKEKFDIIISTRCIQNCFTPFYVRIAKTIGCEHGNYMLLPPVGCCRSLDTSRCSALYFYTGKETVCHSQFTLFHLRYTVKLRKQTDHCFGKIDAAERL